MRTLWSWIVQYWKALGITVPSALAAIGWFYRRYQAQRQRRLDEKVLQALGNHVWPGNRAFTGGGEVGVRAKEIAEFLKLGPDVVADSLERLGTQGKARKEDGTLDNPAPYWFIVRR
jgi:hypothetical protein